MHRPSPFEAGLYQLYAAGVKFGFATFNASSSRTLPYKAVNAVSYGLPQEEALKAITINSAEIPGVGDQLGTIETGKIVFRFRKFWTCPRQLRVTPSPLVMPRPEAAGG